MKKTLQLLLLLCATLFAQGNYYQSIDPSKSSFVTDLQTLIRSNTVMISYDNFDETNVTNFASYDAGNGKRSVDCVYSGEVFTYTPPFKWGTFSREHTYCHSWMPTAPSESGPEYCDQHHLFPTNQNSANGIRSNHVLDSVANVTFTYLACKFGKNKNGKEAFEPRAKHKGDAARALLYMTLRYNGVNGKDWSFNRLNTFLPAQGEDTQSVALLLKWHKQDPPDSWEIKRNDYVQSIQGNRNPFVDHPEYVNYINFYTVSYKSPVGIEKNLKDELSYKLYQNYPNPFNPSTTISYEISKPGNLTLKVYDVMGKEIRTLVEGYQTEGIHHLEFDASNLTSGVYFYQIKNNSKTITKQMILVK